MDLSTKADEEVFRLTANCIVEIMNDGKLRSVAADRLQIAFRETERRYGGQASVGMLHLLGYHVGRTDPVPRDRRQAILRFAFERDLPLVRGLSYMAGWGEPGSSQRRTRLLSQLQWFYDQNVWKPEMNRACIEWKADIDFVSGFIPGTSPQTPVIEFTEDALGEAQEEESAESKIEPTTDAGSSETRREGPAMPPKFRRTLEWEQNGRSFRLAIDDGSGDFLTPDGQLVSLAVEEWRSLAEAIDHLVPKSRTSRPTDGAPNNGTAWSADADAKLTSLWNSGATVAALATEFGRTRGAIKSRLTHIGLIEDRGDGGDLVQKNWSRP